jgi:hypothetical protein
MTRWSLFGEVLTEIMLRKDKPGGFKQWDGEPSMVSGGLIVWTGPLPPIHFLDVARKQMGSSGRERYSTRLTKRSRRIRHMPRLSLSRSYTRLKVRLFLTEGKRDRERLHRKTKLNIGNPDSVKKRMSPSIVFLSYALGRAREFVEGLAVILARETKPPFVSGKISPNGDTGEVY